MRQVKSCGFLIFRDGGKSFLLMEHADRLDLPKGHVDPGETEIECALRELREETGITSDDIVIDPDLRFVSEYIVRRDKHVGGQDAEKTLVIFVGLLKQDVAITPTEHIGYRWIDWKPPHRIQARAIDPLLAAVAEHWGSRKRD